MVPGSQDLGTPHISVIIIAECIVALATLQLCYKIRMINERKGVLFLPREF